MCGISGILDLNLEIIMDLNKKLEKMNIILKHRGPDGNGIWTNKFAGFGHTRLSIIDLSFNIVCSQVFLKWPEF